jgi:peptide/nickel transport system permease protein
VKVTTGSERAGVGSEAHQLEPAIMALRRSPFREPVAIFAMVVLGVILVGAIGAPLISSLVVHHGPNEQFVALATDEFGLPKGPSSEFWFGADQLGRDVFVRTLYGARTSLIVASIATLIATLIAVAAGVLAGFLGGATDSLISRLTDIALALPSTLLILGLVAACSGPEACLGGVIRPGMALVAIVLGLFNWMIAARVLRSRTLSLREMDFVHASRLQGLSRFQIVRKDILPNLVGQVVALVTVSFPLAVLGEASLSFLGIGVPATTPSLGAMLENSNRFITVAWWLMFFPGLVLFGMTMSFNILGEAVRRTVDPAGTVTAVA